MNGCFRRWTHEVIVVVIFLDRFTRLRNHPDSIPPSDRRWLLVAWSADFADVGPTLGRRWLANQHSGWMSLYFADVGPTLGQRWADVGLPTNTQVRCLYFANVGPTLGQRRIFIQDGGEQ